MALTVALSLERCEPSFGEEAEQKINSYGALVTDKDCLSRFGSDALRSEVLGSVCTRSVSVLPGATITSMPPNWQVHDPKPTPPLPSPSPPPSPLDTLKTLPIPVRTLLIKLCR